VPASIFVRAGTTAPVRTTRRSAITRFGRCTKLPPTYAGYVDEVERVLRHLALNDEASVERVLVSGTDRGHPAALAPKVEVLVELGALLALGGATTSLRATVRRATEAGASDAEIVDVLVAVGPAVGLARVVAAAPRLATALGYDLDANE
jgi:4-carboxymuconolactone decarboxylase